MMVLLSQYIIVLRTKLLRLFLGSSVCSMAPAIRAVLNDIAIYFIITIKIVIYFAIPIYTVRSACLELSNLGYSNFPSVLLFLCSRWSATKAIPVMNNYILFFRSLQKILLLLIRLLVRKICYQGIFITLEIKWLE